jgi:hypothetical protein
MPKKEDPSMKIDANEMSELSAVQEAPRVDMYTGIHKALRALMSDTLLAVGRMDCDDDLERAQVCHRVLELLDFCAAHLKHENDFIHSAIEARAPGASQHIAGEHVEHEQHLAALGARVAQLLACPPPQRAALTLALYRELSLFIADNFQHMHVEETAHNAVLQANYSDAELNAIHDALVASIPPAEMMYIARWLVPFMNPAERTGMLSDMQAHAPAPAFDAVIDTVRPHLTDREWGKLARSLGMAPVEGLVAV